jgi:predicted ABC-type ATPase
VTPALWLIAGPNGVGKTTYARRYLRSVAGTDAFVNLDEIARGFQPLRPTPDAETARAAGRSALERLHAAIAARRSVAVETTLAGHTHRRSIALARAQGMRVELIFCALPEVETCLARIAARVAAGGHAVPEGDVRRRYTRAVAHFPDYAALVDHWVVLDTAQAEPRLVAHGPPTRIADAALARALPLRWN